MAFPFQNTIANKVSCAGTGLHSGKVVHMSICPAPEGTGIKFIRTDIDGSESEILASYLNVSDTTLCTRLSNQSGISVSTIEHLMAAFWGCNIDNAIVEIDGSEVPIMDGSSEPFVFLLECAGIVKQGAPRRIIEVLKPVEIVEGNRRAAIMPSDSFSVSLEIDFGDSVVSSQSCVFNSTDVSFKTDLCRARSFCFEHEVSIMREKGLAQGGSLDNAIVVGDNGILNQGGLRYQDEFVRHKVLDCIGDFYLTGAQLMGRFVGFRSGHEMNNKLLRKFFEDRTAWQEVRYVDEAAVSRFAGTS